MNQKTKELNKRNNELDKQINAENQRAFTDIICYLRSANISEYNQELVRQDLLAMVLSAQERGEAMELVIGGDYKEFCDDIIASLPAKTGKQRILGFLDLIFWCVSLLGAINIILADETIQMISDLKNGQKVSYTFSVSVGMVMSMVIILVIAVLVIQMISKNAFKENKENKRGVIVKSCVIGFGLVASFLLSMWLEQETLFTVNIFLACGVVMLLYVLHKILERVSD